MKGNNKLRGSIKEFYIPIFGIQMMIIDLIPFTLVIICRNSLPGKKSHSGFLQYT